MKSTVKKLPLSRVEIEVEVPVDEFQHCFDQATVNLGKDLTVKGFRQGKLPRAIIEKEVGTEKIFTEAANVAVKKHYQKALAEQGIEAISRPEIEIVKLVPNNPFVFRARTSVLPEVLLPDYRKIARTVERKAVVVQEQEIADALLRLQKSRAKFTLKNEAAEKGDFVEIEYWPLGTQDSPQRYKDRFVLGEGHFVAGFEEQLFGMRAGEEKENIAISIPEKHFMEGMAGKQMVLNVKMHSVQQVELPELSDQFALQVGTFETMAQLKANIKEKLVEEGKQKEFQRVSNEVLQEVSHHTKCDVPDILVQREHVRMVEEMKRNVEEHLKISFKKYADSMKKTEQEITDSFKQRAQENVKRSLVLAAIGKQENITVSEQELKEGVSSMAKHYSSVNKAEGALDLKQVKEYTQEIILNQKIVRLLEHLTKTEVL